MSIEDSNSGATEVVVPQHNEPDMTETVTAPAKVMRIGGLAPRLHTPAPEFESRVLHILLFPLYLFLPTLLSFLSFLRDH